MKKPNQDFLRKQKLDFSTMIFYIIAMEAGALKDGLFKLSNCENAMPTASTFVQQRNKIDCHTFEYLLHSFNKMFKPHHFYKNYCLLAIDGSVLSIT